MRTAFSVALAFSTVTLLGCHEQAQHAADYPALSPYVGQEHQPLKALSPKEVSDYLSGAGMGYAKVAELNRHPGPRHVLDLADSLDLTEAQHAETRRIFERMSTEAKRLGREILQREQKLEALFQAEPIDSAEVGTLTREIGALEGELRLIHLRAHIEMKQLLNPEQVNRYHHLRGYASESHGHQGHAM